MRKVEDEGVTEVDPVRMSPEGFEAFVDEILQPAVPVPEMVALARRPAPWEAGDAGHG